jgi:hypothetical protein
LESNIVRVIKSRRMRWTGMKHTWVRREMHTIFLLVLVRKPEGKRSLGRPRCRWEHITMDLGR